MSYSAVSRKQRGASALLTAPTPTALQSLTLGPHAWQGQHQTAASDTSMGYYSNSKHQLISFFNGAADSEGGDALLQQHWVQNQQHLQAEGQEDEGGRWEMEEEGVAQLPPWITPGPELGSKDGGRCSALPLRGQSQRSADPRAHAVVLVSEQQRRPSNVPGETEVCG